MSDGEVVEFDNVDVKAETGKAILCVIGGEQHWIPLSQVDEDSEVYSKDTSGGKLVISEWIAKTKGLV